MKPLRPGQDTVLSWGSGALECRVVASAGHFVLLRPARSSMAVDPPVGTCSLTYLDGMVPMGWDGSVEPGAHPGELRFRVRESDQGADRRSSVRVPLFATVRVSARGETFEAQLLDVSANGMRFRHPGRLPAGTPVRVRASLPQDLRIDADAVVRSSQPGSAAVEFTFMHAADTQAVGAWTVGILRTALAGEG